MIDLSFSPRRRVVNRLWLYVRWGVAAVTLLALGATGEFLVHKRYARSSAPATFAVAEQNGEQAKIAEEEKRFACAINCMDGRVQEAVRAYLREHHGVTYVDMVTEAGPVKTLANNQQWRSIDGIKDRVKISVAKHGSPVIALVAHDECAGNPVAKEQQLRDLRAACKTVEDFGFNATVILLWVERPWTTAHRIE